MQGGASVLLVSACVSEKSISGTYMFYSLKQRDEAEKSAHTLPARVAAHAYKCPVDSIEMVRVDHKDVI